MDLLRQVLEPYIQKGIQFVAIGGITNEFEGFMRSMNELYPNQVKIKFGYDRKLAKKAYAGADFLFNIASVEPCGLCPLIANKYGCLPIIYHTGGLKDNFTDFKYNNGNGYVLKDYDVSSLNDLINRTLHDYENKDKIRNYMLAGMNQKFDIKDCADQYLKLYKEM